MNRTLLYSFVLCAIAATAMLVCSPLFFVHTPKISAGYIYIALLIGIGGMALYRIPRRNVRIYALHGNGLEYKQVGCQHISGRKRFLDLTKLGEYPEGEAIIEIEHATAQRMFGQRLVIYLRDETRAHLIEHCGGGNYWFIVSEDDCDA